MKGHGLMRPRQRALLALSALLLSLNAVAEIRLDVTAAEGKLPAAAKANVLAWLSLSRYRQRDDLDAALMLRLQERASREARAALRPFGFYSATAVAAVQLVPGSNGKHWQARVRVVPGRRVLWAESTLQVSGEGSSEPWFQAALAAHPLRAGLPLEHAAYDALKGDLERTAANYGYLDAQFSQAELQVDPAAGTARAVLRLETGKRYHFGATTLPTDAPVDSALLRRFLRWHEGAPFDGSLLLGTQFALDDSLYFSTVEVLPGERDRQALSVPVVVQLAPGKRQRYAATLGYATDTRGRAGLTWDNRRVNLRGHRARVVMQWANIGRTLEGVYALPVGDPAYEELSFLAGVSDQVLADANTRTTRLKSTLTRARGSWQQAWGLSAERTSTRSGGLRTNDTLVVPSVTLSSAPRGLARAAMGGRGATSGTVADLTGEGFQARLDGSATALGSRSTFLRLYLRDEHRQTLGENWRWTWRGELGSTLVRNFDSLPASYRYFAGGDRSVRGFALNELGPRDAAGLRTGAKHLLVTSLELERKLPHQLAVAVFVDAGDAFNTLHGGVAASVGVGLRYRLPMLNLGLDLAQAVHAPGNGTLPGPRVHLNLSPAF